MKQKVISTTEFRKNISAFIQGVTSSGKTLTVGKRDQPEVVILPFPHNYRNDISELTNMMSNNPAFDFLDTEPDLYSVKDVIVTYE